VKEMGYWQHCQSLWTQNQVSRGMGWSQHPWALGWERELGWEKGLGWDWGWDLEW
jgi:hypothetical protein